MRIFCVFTQHGMFIQAKNSGLFNWPQPESNSASSVNGDSESEHGQKHERRRRQKRIIATQEVLVKEEETPTEIRRWTRRTRWDGSLTPIKNQVYPKAEWVRGVQ